MTKDYKYLADQVVKYECKKIKVLGCLVIIVLSILAISIIWQLNDKLLDEQSYHQPTIKATNARITKYLWTDDKMASGVYPFVGAVATSDRTIPFGTQVQIEGKWYIVMDRTNKRIKNTFDIYTTESKAEALKFGAKNRVVIFK